MTMDNKYARDWLPSWALDVWNARRKALASGQTDPLPWASIETGDLHRRHGVLAAKHADGFCCALADALHNLAKYKNAADDVLNSECYDHGMAKLELAKAKAEMKILKLEAMRLTKLWLRAIAERDVFAKDLGMVMDERDDLQKVVYEYINARCAYNDHPTADTRERLIVAWEGLFFGSGGKAEP